jgi:protein-S-isoprenylcysteine O-methyltransferase Ste14
MPLNSYLVLLAFFMSGMILLLWGFFLRREGNDLVGIPAIEKFYFITGKVAIFASWALFIMKAIFPNIGYILVPTYLTSIATGLLWIGTIIFAFAFINLGRSLKVGLPKQETTLKTHGIYKFSRNPLYVGVHLIAIASCLYFPDLINVSFTIYGIYIHHKIIKGEERFLSRRFGTEWDDYCAHVRRYI